MDFVIFLLIFFALLFVPVLLRLKFSNFELKITDLALAIVPAVLYLLLNGNIKSLQVGDLTVETAFKEAAKTSAANIVTKIDSVDGLPTKDISSSPKGGVDPIPILINEKAEAITFRVGWRGYDGGAISEYFRHLSRYDFFKYIILLEKDGSLFGTLSVPTLNKLIENNVVSTRELATALNRGNKNKLPNLPSFISVKDAINTKTSKADALAKMNSLSINNIPVIDAKKKFKGVVNRSKL